MTSSTNSANSATESVKAVITVGIYDSEKLCQERNGLEQARNGLEQGLYYVESGDKNLDCKGDFATRTITNFRLLNGATTDLEFEAGSGELDYDADVECFSGDFKVTISEEEVTLVENKCAGDNGTGDEVSWKAVLGAECKQIPDGPFIKFFSDTSATDIQMGDFVAKDAGSGVMSCVFPTFMGLKPDQVLEAQTRELKANFDEERTLSSERLEAAQADVKAAQADVKAADGTVTNLQREKADLEEEKAALKIDFDQVKEKNGALEKEALKNSTAWASCEALVTKGVKEVEALTKQAQEAQDAVRGLVGLAQTFSIPPASIGSALDVAGLDLATLDLTLEVPKVEIPTTVSVGDVLDLADVGDASMLMGVSTVSLGASMLLQLMA